MTCKDCIHYDVCKCVNSKVDEMYGNRNGTQYGCGYFKDKSQIIELPNVEIGQALFYIDGFTRTVESDIVSRLTWEQTDLGVQTGVWSENNGFSEFFNDIGKTLFLTKVEAEAKLKELKK